MAKVERLKKKRKKSGTSKILISVVSLIVLSLIAAVLITNKGKFSFDGLSRIFGADDGNDTASAFFFDAGNDNVYTDLDGGFAAVSTVGLQAFDKSGAATVNEMFGMTCPTVCSAGRIAAAYDLGGTALRIFDTGGVITRMDTEEKIISAAVNESGWLALCMQKSGYLGAVTVYNAKGDLRYRFDSGEGYVLSAALSADNQNLAVLTLTAAGSKITVFGLDSDQAVFTYEKPDKLILETEFMADGRLLTIAEDSVFILDTRGNAKEIINYSDKYLAGYSTDGAGFISLLLNDYTVGGQGTLETVNIEGEVLGSLLTDRQCVSLSAKGNYMAVLWADGLTVYDKTLKEYAVSEDTAGAVQVIMRSNGSALVVSSNSATVFQRSDS
jgi:hypothetical protein